MKVFWKVCWIGLWMALLLGSLMGCSTMAGVGRDVQKAGQALEKVAD